MFLLAARNTTQHNTTQHNTTQHNTTQTMKKALVVTTEYKGVFFGYGEPTHNDTIELEQCQMCLYWSCSMHGVLGLAAGGPDDGCRIGPAVPRMILRKVTGIIEATPEAEVAWKKAPWL